MEKNLTWLFHSLSAFKCSYFTCSLASLACNYFSLTPTIWVVWVDVFSFFPSTALIFDELPFFYVIQMPCALSQCVYMVCVCILVQKRGPNPDAPVIAVRWTNNDVTEYKEKWIESISEGFFRFSLADWHCLAVPGWHCQRCNCNVTTFSSSGERVVKWKAPKRLPCRPPYCILLDRR